MAPLTLALSLCFLQALFEAAKASCAAGSGVPSRRGDLVAWWNRERPSKASDSSYPPRTASDRELITALHAGCTLRPGAPSKRVLAKYGTASAVRDISYFNTIRYVKEF